MCRQTTDLQLTRAVMAEAVQAASPAWLCSTRRSGGPDAAGPPSCARGGLHEILDGVRSAPEAELRALLETSTILPKALWNPTLRTPDGRPLPTPDGYIHEAALAFEVDSREFHADPDGWARTLDRTTPLSEYGIDTAHFTPTDIRRRPRAACSGASERIYLQRIGRVPVQTSCSIPRLVRCPYTGARRQ